MEIIPFLLFLIGTIGLGIGLYNENENDILRIIAEVVSLYFCMSIFISLIILLFDRYSLLNSLLLTNSILIMYFGINYMKFINHIKKKQTNFSLPFQSFIVIIFILFMIPFIYGRYEFVEMTGDAGVYSISAMHIANQGKLSATLDVRNELPNSMKTTYDNDNLLFFDTESKRGSFLPGTYLDTKEESNYYFQFYPVWPIVLASGAELFSTSNMYYIMLLLYVLSLLLFYYSLMNLGTPFLYSLLGLIMLGTSPLTVHFTKYPTSELFLLFLIILTFYLLTQKSISKMLMGSFVVTLYCLAHISSFMYLPLLLLVLPFMYCTNNYKLSPFLTISFLGFLISLPYGYYVSYQYFIDVYYYSFSRIFGEGLAYLGFTAIITIAVFGLFFSFFGWVKAKKSSNQIIYGKEEF